MIPRDPPKPPNHTPAPCDMMFHAREQMETEKPTSIQMVTGNQDVMKMGRMSVGLEVGLRPVDEGADSRVIEREMLHMEKIELNDL